MPAGWHWNKAEQEKLRGNAGPAARSWQRIATAQRLRVEGLKRRNKKKGLFAETVDKVSHVLDLLDELMKARKALLENVRRMKISLTLLKASQFRLCQKVDQVLAPNLPVWKAELDGRIAQRLHDQDQRALDHLELLAADDERTAARSVRLV
jgi:seryl-tRNA synthetase